MVTSGEWESGGGTLYGQGIKRYKLLYVKQAAGVYCITKEIQPIFYNNYKWSITYKNCESLYCIPVIYAVASLMAQW